jgi:SAM-dependent methyltransferase
VCLDRESDNLGQVVRKVGELGLNNVETMVLTDGLPSALETGSFDFILLFDALHAYRFPSMQERSALFRELRRLLKADGRLSYSPTNSAGYWGLTPSKLLAEVEECGFAQAGVTSDDLSRQGVLQRITAYSYRKG